MNDMPLGPHGGWNIFKKRIRRPQGMLYVQCQQRAGKRCRPSGAGSAPPTLLLMMMNRYPYVNGHLLIAPTAMCRNWGDLEPQERGEMMNL